MIKNLAKAKHLLKEAFESRLITQNLCHPTLSLILVPQQEMEIQKNLKNNLIKLALLLHVFLVNKFSRITLQFRNNPRSVNY